MKRTQSFEWQSDKEEGWDDLPPLASAGRKSGRHRLLLVSVLLIVFVAGLVTYLQLNRRVTITTRRMEDELLASHRLLFQAVIENDSELFDSLLYTKDTRWYKLQRSLQKQQLFLDRAPLGLWVDSSQHAEAAQSRETKTLLSPDLTQAVVTQHLPYISVQSEGLTQTIQLEQTMVYQLSDNHWLLSQPQDERAFWGSWLRQEGNYLKLFYPARDEEIGNRLFPQLDEIIGRLCDQPDIGCPDEFQLQLRLSRYPDSLLQLQQIRRGISPGSYHMDLPAPTWVGRPLDEVGYRALYRGYAGWLAAALVNSFSVSELIDNKTLDNHLRPLNLRAPALPSAQPLQDQRLLPLPLPEQDVLLLCDSFLPPRLLRYDPTTETWQDSADQAEGPSFTSVLRNSNPLILPLPDDTGVLAQVRQAVDGTPWWRIFTWRDGQERLLAQDTNRFTPLPPILQNHIDPSWQRMVFYEEVEDASEEIPFLWIDLSDCPDAPCRLRPAEGLPLWSPDRQHTLLTKMSADGRSILYHGDGLARASLTIGPGAYPFWIDDHTYAYVRPKGFQSEGRMDLRAGFELVTANLPTSEGAPEAITIRLDSEELLAALPVQIRPEHLWIRAAVNLGNQAGTLLVWATGVDEMPGGTDFLFSYDMTSDSVHFLLDLGEERLMESWMPADNQRSLALVSTASANSTLWVLDLTRGEIVWRTTQGTVRPIIDWAAGGEWLVLVEDGLLKLIAPGYAYEKAIFHNLSGCRSVAWVNR